MCPIYSGRQSLHLSVHAGAPASVTSVTQAEGLYKSFFCFDFSPSSGGACDVLLCWYQEGFSRPVPLVFLFRVVFYVLTIFALHSYATMQDVKKGNPHRDSNSRPTCRRDSRILTQPPGATVALLFLFLSDFFLLSRECGGYYAFLKGGRGKGGRVEYLDGTDALHAQTALLKLNNSRGGSRRDKRQPEFERKSTALRAVTGSTNPGLSETKTQQVESCFKTSCWNLEQPNRTADTNC